jgi:uncharacterized protein YkwD
VTPALWLILTPIVFYSASSKNRGVAFSLKISSYLIKMRLKTKRIFFLRAINSKIAIILLGCLIACTAQATHPIVQPPIIPTGFTKEEVELLALTNKERHLKGLQPLRMNKILTIVARSHAVDMAHHRHLSHTINGRNFICRIKASGYPVAKAGENVARSKRSPLHVIKMWMKSPAHRKNILNRHFKEVGFGIQAVRGGDKYFAQVFGVTKTDRIAHK